MAENPKKINLGNPDKLPESDRTSDSYLKNPGLKGDQEDRDKKTGGLFNEDPMEEKRAIEEESEDRLNAAE